MLSMLWKSDLFDERKHVFLKAVTLSVLFYPCTTWILKICLEKSLIGHTEECYDDVEEILEVEPHKTAAERSLASHHKKGFKFYEYDTPGIVGDVRTNS